MNILTEPFPESLLVGGVECPIHWDFRTILKCDKLLRAEELDGTRLLEVLELFYQETAEYTEEHIEKMFWFFSCGREEKKRRFPRKAAGINDKQSFDFEKDADLIYAGFLQQYGIDLRKTEMHWWKFMILVENLGSDTKLAKVMEYRTIDTANKNLSKEMRSFYRAMQKYYGLDQIPELDEKSKQIEDALMNGGDVMKLLEEQ